MAHYDGSSNSIIRPVRSPLGSPVIRHFAESTCASSAVIRRGDPVTFDTVVTTGNLRIVKAPSSQGNAGNLLQNGIRSLVGIAMADSTSDGGIVGLSSNGARQGAERMIPVAVADGLTEFSVQISSVGATPKVVSSTLIGGVYPLELNRTHQRWFLSSTNLSTAADLSVVITDVPSEMIGDTGGLVYFKFLSTMVSQAVRVGGPSVT
jgi:hypothetical protein